MLQFVACQDLIYRAAWLGYFWNEHGWSHSLRAPFIHSAALAFLLLPADITEIGRCAKTYCEHTARSTPTLPDVVITLIEMGKWPAIGLHLSMWPKFFKQFSGCKLQNCFKSFASEGTFPGEKNNSGSKPFFPWFWELVLSVSTPIGFNVDTLPVYAKRSQRMVITARKYPLRILKAGLYNIQRWKTGSDRHDCVACFYSSCDKSTCHSQSTHCWTEAHTSCPYS